MASSGHGPATVVIVHRNQSERCLDTIARFLEQGVAVAITVVDNGSEPEHLNRLESCRHEIELVRTGQNLGFGPGANVGLRRWLRRGVGEWAVVAPHDALLGVGGISRLISETAAIARAGMSCADVGDQATPLVDPFLGAFQGPTTVRRGWEPAAYPHGTLMLFRRECLEQIGIFDERYFAYNDEADLGLRASEHGWEVGLVRGEMVENPTMGTHPEIVDYLRLRNTVLLLGTHFGRVQAGFRIGVAVLNIAHASVRPAARPPWFSARARTWAVIDAVRGRYGPPTGFTPASRPQ
jgi:N-acetylglucosaminyl-diphospho-decaprenol L-rhamnosyltransferase